MMMEWQRLIICLIYIYMTRTAGRVFDATGKSEYAEAKELKPLDRADWGVRGLSELGDYKSINDFIKADIFGFDISDVSRSIRLFSAVMKKLGNKLDGDELYVEFQRIYDESVRRDTDNDKVEDKIWNRGRGR